MKKLKEMMYFNFSILKKMTKRKKKQKNCAHKIYGFRFFFKSKTVLEVFFQSTFLKLKMFVFL